MSASWLSLLLALITFIERFLDSFKALKNKKQQAENQLLRQKAIELERLLLAIKTRRMVKNEKPNTIHHNDIFTDKLRKSKDRYHR